MAVAALKRVSTSIWGASFLRSRVLYNATVRPSMTYGHKAWYTPEQAAHSRVIKKLELIQSSGLRAVAGAFRATPIRELETETFITPLDIHCSELRARHLRRTYSSLVGTFI
jgi:hypothetical protein